MRRVYVGRLSHHVRESDVERFFRREGKIREVLMKDGFAFVEFDHSDDADKAVRHLNGRDLNGDRVHVEFAKGPPRGRGDGGSRLGGGGMVGGSRGSMSRNGPIGRSFRNDRGGRDRGDYSSGRSGGSSGGGGGGGGGGISYAEKYGPPRNTDFRVIVENLSSRVSWQDLKDLMRQAGEVTFADAHKRQRNMGIVDFASLKDMKHAIETLDDTEFHGRRIKVFEDKTRRHRSSGGSGFSNSRRGDRSRSRSRGRYSSSKSRSRSRSRDRERTPVSRSVSRSRSRTRSPPNRERPMKSRSKSASSSPARRKAPRSRSRSRSRSRDSPQAAKRESRTVSRSRSRSASAESSAKQQRSRSRSRSASSSRSRGSNANNNNNNNNNSNSNKLTGGDYDRSSRSRSRSASRSASPDSKKARLSVSPKREKSLSGGDS